MRLHMNMQNEEEVAKVKIALGMRRVPISSQISHAPQFLVPPPIFFFKGVQGFKKI
jgi:hypothetical protein